MQLVNMTINRYFYIKPRQFLFFLFLATLNKVEAIPSFQSKIPNGSNVPDPCNLGSVWSAVGHTSSTRGSRSSLNPFGQDFNSAGQSWSVNLCRQDSDGDGRTNGQELGDPNCQWANTGGFQQQLPNTGLSHPGICEPINSPTCMSRNNFLDVNQCNSGGSSSNNGHGSSANDNSWKLLRQCACFCRDRHRDFFQGDGSGSSHETKRWHHNNNPFSQQSRNGPPISSTPEFNQPSVYAVKNSCTCACPNNQPIQ